MFVLHVDLAPDSRLEENALSILDETERRRYHRIQSGRARREFVLCRAALRVNLTERLGCTGRQLSFGCLEHGKPFAKVAGRPVGTAFNVSHSDPHGLIAIADNGCVGVDLEMRSTQRDLEGIGSFVYGPEEQRLLKKAKGWQKVHLFYRLWSLKEALIKALGTGFSLSPSEFEIPDSILGGASSCIFRYPHQPSDAWRLVDLGDRRFAAALAYRLPQSPELNLLPTASR